MGLNKFKEAIEKMTKLLCLPTKCSHQIYVDAYKKLVLMGMIEGYAYKVPDFAQEKIQKLLKMDDGQSD